MVLAAYSGVLYLGDGGSSGGVSTTGEGKEGERVEEEKCEVVAPPEGRVGWEVLSAVEWICCSREEADRTVGVLVVRQSICLLGGGNGGSLSMGQLKYFWQGLQLEHSLPAFHSCLCCRQKGYP